MVRYVGPRLAPGKNDNLTEQTRKEMSVLVGNSSRVPGSILDIYTVVCNNNRHYLGFGGPWFSAMSDVVFILFCVNLP